MRKVNLYKSSFKKKEDFVSSLYANGYEEHSNKYTGNERRVEYEIISFYKTVVRNYPKDERVLFLEEELEYVSRVYIISFILKKEDEDKEHIFWIKMGFEGHDIDNKKNINYPFYYLSNITDFEEYTLVKESQKEFNLFSGEVNKTMQSDRKRNLKDYIGSINLFKKNISELSILVNSQCEIGQDLGIAGQEEIEILFKNGITIPYRDEDSENIENFVKKVCNVFLRYTERRNVIKIYQKLSSKAKDLDLNNIDDISSLFLVKNANSMQLEKIDLEEIQEENGKKTISKKMIGFYIKDDKLYFINYNGDIYKIKKSDVSITSLINTNEFIKNIGVLEYNSEVDFLGKVDAKETADYYICRFHANHYIENGSTKFEICDIFYFDKRNNQAYLIFAKYKYQISSSEVFWQSKLVLDKFKDGKININKLEKLFNKVGLDNSYRGIEYFENAKFINLILPEKDNVSTTNLDNIINIWKNNIDEQKMEIWIPSTKRSEDGGTKIICE